MKKYFFSFFIFLLLFSNSSFANNKDYKETKDKAYALYATKNYKEAFNILDNLPFNQKDEEIFLLLANIQEEFEDNNSAIRYLNKALDINNEYYKAYYNLGCIFAKRNSYMLAINNFELAVKYNKNFANGYYNLACCQIKLKNYKEAKKNLIKALEFDNTNKDYYYNLAYCYKELGQIKQAKRIIKTYNSLS